MDYLRLRDVVLHLVDPRPGLVVLNVGCSSGAMMVYCGLQGSTVYGQDLNAKSVSTANQWLKRFGITGGRGATTRSACSFRTTFLTRLSPAIF